MNKNKGFTLVELMIGIAIIGVLVAIAYPSYTNSLIKGNRASAKAVLMDAAQKQQQYLLDNRAYGDTAAIVAAMGGTLPPEFSKFYTLKVEPDVGPPRSFVATATPKPGTRQAGDGALTIDHTGKKDPPEKW